jgi:hypothetical protein
MSISINNTSIVSIASTKIVISVSLSNKKNPHIDNMGICWTNSHDQPTLSDSYVELGPTKTRSSTFSANMSDLSPSTTYFVRAFAVDRGETVYGPTIQATTSESVIEPPVIRTPLPDQFNFDGDEISLDISNNFFDRQNKPLVYSASNLPPNLSCSPFGLITGTIEIVSNEITKQLNVEVTVSNGDRFVVDSFIWTIAPSDENVVYVNANNTGTKDGSFSHPWPTLQEAVDAAPDGSTVKIAAGVYNENVTAHRQNIKIIGETDHEGNPLAILEPPKIDIVWTPAEHVGPGVWVTTDIPSNRDQIATMSYDGVFVTRIRNFGGINDQGWMGSTPGVDAWGWELLASTDPWLITDVGDDGKRPITRNNGNPVNFWDAISCVWAQHPTNGETYFKHKHGLDPNNLNIVVGESNAAGIFIYFNLPKNIDISNLWLRGYDRAIYCRKADNLDVHHNKITCYDRCGICYHGHVVNSFIRHNEFTLGLEEDPLGAWGTYSPHGSVEAGLAELMYDFYKYAYHTSSSGSLAVGLWDGSDNVVVEHNNIHDSMSAISIWGFDNMNFHIRHNQISDCSSIGLACLPGSGPGFIYNNRIHSCNIIFRLHRLHQDRPCNYYIYNNICVNPAYRGSIIFTHWFMDEPQPTALREYNIYHNTFSGSYNGLTFNEKAASFYKDIDSINLLNNIFSISNISIYPQIDLPDATLGNVDYNWFGGGFYDHNRTSDWCGPNNIFEEHQRIWSDTETEFKLPDGHAAIDSAGPIPSHWPVITGGFSKNMGVTQR